MPTWPTRRIRRAVIQAIAGCGGAVPPNVGDDNTVGDFFPGARDLSPAVKGCITAQIKRRCELEEFWWPREVSTTIARLIMFVRAFQSP